MREDKLNVFDKNNVFTTHAYFKRYNLTTFVAEKFYTAFTRTLNADKPFHLQNPSPFI